MADAFYYKIIHVCIYILNLIHDGNGMQTKYYNIIQVNELCSGLCRMTLARKICHRKHF